MVAAEDEEFDEGEDKFAFFASSTSVFSIMSCRSEERELRIDKREWSGGLEDKAAECEYGVLFPVSISVLRNIGMCTLLLLT
jgi:hypothetical protein